MPETSALPSVNLIAAHLWRPAEGDLVKTMSRPKPETTTHLVITLALAVPLALPLVVASTVTLVASAASVTSAASVDAADGSGRPARGQLARSGCTPVPAAECGTIRVPLDRSRP